MTATCTRAAYFHFAQRVAERIGDHIEPEVLWSALCQAIADNSDTVEFIARVNRKGRRVWRFEVGGDPFFMIYDHEVGCPITILSAEGSAGLHSDIGGAPINLGDYA